MSENINFLGLDFRVESHAGWRDLLLEAEGDGFRYLVTPNVDHVVQLSKRPELTPAYAAADWRMCDSRILERLGRMRNLQLGCYPGADLVRDLLEDPRSLGRKIAVVGPDAGHFAILQRQFPRHALQLIDAPRMEPGSPAWERVILALEEAGADLALLCISFPKQELLAHALKTRGRARGVAICAGASVDFLTGQQHRAPEIFRRAGMEWLHRLLSQPGRLWRRYLVDGPRIFVLFLRDGAR